MFERGDNMNNKRRTRLKRAKSYIDVAFSIVEEVSEEEQNCLENFPDGIKNGDRGSQMKDNLDVLCRISEGLQNAVEEIDRII